MNDDYFKRVMTILVLASLLLLTFFLLKPLLIPIIIGLILAFMFSPLYDRLDKLIKMKNLSAFLIVLLLILLIVVPFFFITPIFVDQSVKIYLASQSIDLVTPLRETFPSFFASESFSVEVSSIFQTFLSKIADSLLSSLSNFILNFPVLFLQFSVVLFTFFFVLRDKDKFTQYIQSLSPFTKEVDDKIFEASKAITFSVIYGGIVVGTLQGLISGASFFIFGVPNALFFTVLAILAGILPIIGTVVVWGPIAISMLIAGDSLSAFGIIAFGLLSSVIDNILKPIIVSKRTTTLNSSLILIGMVGGLFLFGIMGLIIGPLVLAYLFIILETYRKRGAPSILQEVK